MTLYDLIAQLEAAGAECIDLNVGLQSESDDERGIQNDEILYVKENCQGMLFDESE